MVFHYSFYLKQKLFVVKQRYTSTGSMHVTFTFDFSGKIRYIGDISIHYSKSKERKEMVGFNGTVTILVITASLLLGSCAPRQFIKTDFNSIITDAQSYKGQYIEIEGSVDFKHPRWGFSTWYFMLNEDGKKIRCYENNYRVTSWSHVSNALRKAVYKKEKIIVRGKFNLGYKNEPQIELDFIEYGGVSYNTDHKPPSIRMPF